MSQEPTTDIAPDYVHLSVRLTRDTADRFKRVADAEYRPVATELRRMIEARIAAFDAPEDVAA
jgi:predicted DNA-binding protein